MSRPPMVEHEILQIKEIILDNAAKIILEEGFQGFSMRKIGKKIGMTGANLYNYYANKDEINIAIRLRAGKLLFEALHSAYKRGQRLSEKMWLMIKAMVDFGITQSPYFGILFDLPTPKYTDYIGTPLEALAKEELDSSLKNQHLVMTCIEEFVDAGYQIPGSAKNFLIVLWSQTHGLVSIYNNGLLELVDETPAETVVEVTKLLYEIVCRMLNIVPESID